MYKPSAVADQSSNIMVQTLNSLFQRVQIFGSEESPPELDSPRMPRSENYQKSTLLAAVSKPIPYTGGYSNYKYGDCSLESNYDNSLAESSINENSLAESSNYENSLAESTNYEHSLFPQDLESNSSDSYSAYRENEYSDKSDYEDSLEDDHTKSRKKKKTSLQEINLCEVAQHDMFHDCWIVFYDKVYDVTSFLYEHPGGEELLMEHAGRDGTMAFRSVGHSKAALESLKDYIIGVLPPHERIFNNWETN